MALKLSVLLKAERCGEGEVEGGAFALLGLNANASAIMFNDGFGYGEAQTGTLDILVHLDKGIKHRLASLFVHATAGVGHIEIVLTNTLHAATHTDGTLLGKLQSVANQVGKNL